LQAELEDASMGDPAREMSAVRIEPDALSIEWADGHCSRFPAVWLRHAPGFPNARPPVREHGRFPRRRYRIKSAIESPAGELEVLWEPDQVEARYPLNWLRSHCPSDKERQARRRPLALWDRGVGSRLPEIGDIDFQSRDEARLDLFRKVLDYGFCLVRDVPLRDGEVQRVSELFGIVPSSPYSDDPRLRGVDRIRFDPARNTGGFTAHALLPHTDSCWRQSVNGMTLMHCLEAHPGGGESLLVDGFQVANRLRETAPEAFDLLSNVPLPFAAPVSSQDEWRAMGRVIHCDADGEVMGIRYNGNSIHGLDLPEHLLRPACESLERFEEILYDPELCFRMMLRPGDLLVMDNQRVLHGRTAFNPSDGARHMQSCIVDRDLFHNRFLALARRLQAPDAELVLPSGLC
jgi:gamma-butyrobetaine dioxygenase